MNKVVAGFLYKLVGFILLLIVFSSAKADTIQVGGIIASDQHWTSGNTYVVTQDLRVTNNLKLIIDAGVIVKIDFGRGIIIDNATLMINGELNDTVFFSPNYFFPGSAWNWKGIEVKNIDENNDVQIEYANIYKAEVAIGIENSLGIKIRNSHVYSSQITGIALVGSSSSYLKNCNIIDNYVGVEISASFLEKSSDNIISNCIIKNENNNIYFTKEAGGIVKNNKVEKNIISSGYGGIWMLNNGESMSSANIISENIIIHNGDEFGYGIYTNFDSTQILNNIFWDNNNALYIVSDSKYSTVSKNSFYQNKNTIIIGQGSASNSFKNNTLSENTNEYLKIRETEGIIFTNNNILNYSELNNIVINFSDTDLDIPLNYWGTDSTERIQNLIYDKEDSPLYGKLNFMPVKLLIDTLSPVSPVFKVKKQLVGNNLKVSWKSNKEIDFKSYRLYFGDFKDYSFSSYMDNITDTVIVLPQNFDIEDDIAITAIDSLASNMYLLDGHESPFAFAVAYPYAGEDTMVCNDINAFDIVSSSAPFEYDQLFWETNGDGEFNNMNLTTPQYYFGNNDFESGDVTLTMNVIINNVTYQDSLQIEILKSPIAFAGNDTIILRDDDYYCVNSYAKNYDSINWISLGDGVFDTLTNVNPIYNPGNVDNQTGSVILLINAYSKCGVETDTINVLIEPYYSMQGNLIDDIQMPYPGNVVAMRIDEDQTARAYQMQSVTTDGKFKFNKLRGGNYYLYGVPDTNNYENYIPAYYPNKINWNNAYKLDLKVNTYDLDIILQSVDYVLPLGEASISGHVNNTDNKNYNSEIYCEPWFNDNMLSFCSGGSSNITVFLYNSDKSKVLDYTLSDWQGNFFFNDLPYGNYVLAAEKAGYNSFPSDLIKLNQENKIEDDLLLEISNQNITFKLSDNIEIDDELKIYPNPATNKINISSVRKITSIIIFDKIGNKVFEYEPNNERELTINLQSFDKGIYFLNINMPNKKSTKKIIFLGM